MQNQHRDGSMTWLRSLGRITLNNDQATRVFLYRQIGQRVNGGGRLIGGRFATQTRKQREDAQKEGEM